MSENKAPSRGFSNKRLLHGGYAVLITVVAIAVVVLVNYGLSLLDNRYDLKIDLTQSKKYSLDDQTKKVISGLTSDIYIYTLYTPGSEDSDVTGVLQKIKALSGRVHLENVDPDRDPAFMKKYQQSSSTISAGSVIVSDADAKLFRVLDQYAQYTYEVDQSTGDYVPTQLKVEGAVTSAINYIQLGYIPTAYLVQGHGELTTDNLSDISANMSDQNYNLQTINIDQTPDKIKAGDLVMFLDPQKDITDAEFKVLQPLMEKGGRFLFVLDPMVDATQMPNLMALLKIYDIELKSGMVIEKDSSHMYTPQYPDALVPDIQSHTITDPITSSNVSVLIPDSGALKLPDVPPDTTMKITSLLKSSSTSYLKSIDVLKNAMQGSGDVSSALAQSDTDETGPFDLAAAVEKDNNTGNTDDDVRFVIIYDTQFITSNTLSLTSFSNIDLFMNSLGWMKNSAQDIYVRPKTDSTPQLSITTATQFWTISVISVLLVPIIMIVAGVFIYLKRKHL